MDSSHIAWNCLRLVYPPVSSLDAEPLVADKQVEAVLERSKFYLIGKRPQIFFGEPIVKNKGSNIALTLQMTREDGS
ncbi:MAG: hypothetical protein L0H39_11795, partial [Brachybacterium sp.]|nr:hypothetical protein [Brachybacterium sp.]